MKIKTQQEIKDNYAKSVGYESWFYLVCEITFNRRADLLIEHIDEAMNLVAKSVAQQALENASENATMVAIHNGVGRDIVIDKSSITNPDNIPKI